MKFGGGQRNEKIFFIHESDRKYFRILKYHFRQFDVIMSNVLRFKGIVLFDLITPKR